MSKGLKKIITGLLIIPVMAFGVAALGQVGGTGPVGAASGISEITDGMNATGVQNTGAPQNAEDTFSIIVNIMFFIIGAVSVIMLIYGGIRYTTSGGNATSVTAAKNTIMYSIVGLVVAILAFAIVNFVVTNLN